MSKDEEEKKPAATDHDDESTDEEEEDDESVDESDDTEGHDDDGEEDEDEEEDEEVAAQPVDSLHPHATEPQDPTWWVPHAVLGVLVAFGFLGFFGVFNSLLRPTFQKMGIVGEEMKEEAHAPAKAPPASAPTQAPRPLPGQPPKGAEQGETFGARHLLVQYKGSKRAPATITRTQDEAKKRAEEALAKAKAPGAKFEDVVGEYSDEPGAAQRGGNLGNFARGMMDPAFQGPLEKLKVGEISGLVETPFGYHVILRTK